MHFILWFMYSIGKSGFLLKTECRNGNLFCRFVFFQDDNVPEACGLCCHAVNEAVFPSAGPVFSPGRPNRLRGVYSRLCANESSNDHERKKQYEHCTQNKKRNIENNYFYFIIYLGKGRR